MIGRLMVAGWFAGFALAGCVEIPGQTPDAAASVAVFESKASALLKLDAIQVQLPLSVPAAEGERAIAWLLSPSGARSGETAVDLGAGSRSASLMLPLPKDSRGNPAEQIGWYRVGYRIETAGTSRASGTLAIGGIVRNLLELRMASEERLVTGKPLSVRVYAGNPVTRTPFRGVHLEATLAFDADQAGKPAKQTIAREATTDKTGEAILSFPGPAGPGETATLRVKGTLTGFGAEDARATASISKDFESNDNTVIRIETDKPLHKPGETVHMRALVFNDAGRAAANTALTLTVSDPENKTLLEVPLTTNRFGIAAYDWKTGPQLVPGDYDASFGIDSTSSYEGSESSTIRIQRYELPEFTVSATMDRGYYLKGETPVVKIHAGYLFGKPVAAGQVRIVRASESRWNPRTGKQEESDSAEQTATLDGKGDAELHLEIKSAYEDFKSRDYERFTDLEYRAIVTDASTGRSEPRNFTVRLTRDPVHIYLGQLGGDGRGGEYMLSTSYADGVPAAAKVTLDWIDDDQNAKRAAAVTTNRYGLARVHLRYPPHEEDDTSLSLRLLAHDPEGRISKLDDTIDPSGPYGPQSIWISVAHTLLKPSQAIEAVVHGPAGSTIDIDAVAESGLLRHQQIYMANEDEPATFAGDAQVHGLVTLRAYNMNSDQSAHQWGWPGYSGYKSVLYPEDRGLKIKLTGLESSYLPGAGVDAGLEVHEADGQAAPGAFGVAVFDTAVEQRAQTEAEANEHWFGWSWWLDRDNVAGITRETLDQLDMSRPIPEDLDLAAERLLGSQIDEVIQIEAEDNDEVRNEYEATMRHELEPLSKAVLAAQPTRLPTTIEELRDMAHAAKLDDTLLLDPWNTPYTLKTSDDWRDEVLSLVSAGPDKRTGTADDFNVELVRRNMFQLPGERLTKILRDAFAAGRALPGTLDGLKELARGGGLDLDSTLDPEGKPYKYAILVRRRSYSIQVSTHQGYDLWTSPGIDYFSPTEARMEAAIRDWLAAGKLFPDTEAEARQVFAAAGIDMDALRDPLGEPLQLHSTELMAYTRQEKIRAGGSVDETSKPVTRVLRAIQILRAADPATGKHAANDGDLVAQFLHPVTEQSGSDLKPKALDAGTFKGNTGAIGGTVTDRTGAIIEGAVVTVQTSEGVEVATGRTLANGSYVIADLVPRFYAVEVTAKGFESFKLREVYVSAASLTTVDVELNVGAETATVTVEASASSLQTDSASVSTYANAKLAMGVAAPDRKIVAGPNGKATISEPTFTPRLRHVFEETAYWTPSLETDDNGRASVHFTLPDSLTTWKLHALASTVDGRVAALDQTFKTFQPFFVDLDAPQVLTVGDEITLPVNLRNYTEHALALPVTVKPADWLTLLTPSTVRASVASNASTPVVFGFRASQTVEAGPLRISAANAKEGDAVEKTVRVHPDGEPRDATASGLLRTGATTLALDLPADTIPGSLHAELRLYPNLGAHILHAMKAVLERPYGCGEQTISSTYPSLLFLELLKSAKSDSPMKELAQTYLQMGYDRLLGYFGAGGGITYWGRADETPDVALTAYGLEFLTEAQPYIPVDQSRIAGAVGWLAANQKADGGWKPQYGETDADLNLYVAASLERVLAGDDASSLPKELRERANKAVTQAQAWAASSAAAAHDPYANALRLRLTHDAATAAGLRAELARTAVRDRDSAYWTSSRYSPFYGWGHAGDLETTALVLGALGQARDSARDRTLVDGALFYLLENQDRYGIWLSGQATVRVLQALLPLAIEEMKTAGGSPEFRLTVNGTPLDDKDAEALHADPRLLEAPRSLNLTALLKPGHNELVFTSGSETALASAEASAGFYVPWQGSATQARSATQTGKDYGLDLSYSCGVDNARAGQPIDCTVDVRRFGSGGYGMLLAEVGLPPGADVDRASLATLLDHWTISRYELHPDRILFYLWSWRAEGSKFTFRLRPRYGVHAKAAPATLFDYYNPDLKVVLAPQTFTVGERAPK
jgi:hypothetical protein